MVGKPFAFVLMPFEAAFDDVYKLGIQAAATDAGVIAERVDEQNFSETILDRIYRQIEFADFIVADMTGRNPNVFYEVGYAHALNKPCALITKTVDDIPFDLKHHRHIVYGQSIQKLKSSLNKEFSWLIEEKERSTIKKISIELKSVYGDLVKSESYADAIVEFTFDIHNRTDQRSPEIEAMYVYSQKGWSFKQGSETCPNTQAGGDDARLRHFFKLPVTRLSTGAWAQVSLTARKAVWTKWSGAEIKDKYALRGRITLELCTSEGNFTESFPLDVVVEELPF